LPRDKPVQPSSLAIAFLKAKDELLTGELSVERLNKVQV
jgi:hypothetical protein